MKKLNLNLLKADNDMNNPEVQIKDNSYKKGKTEIFFRNLEENLIQQINQADIVVGCVAWLTNENILKALAQKASVNIVVQKEDFLRPETKSQYWAKNLRRLYSGLKSFSIIQTKRKSFFDNVSFMSERPPVVCVGNHNADKSPAHPRMHNKFMVFFKESKKAINGYLPTYEPYAVWTGSFNMTHNATMSLENAVLISDVDIAYQYYNEFGQIYALAEYLDWEKPWCAPDFRIGS
jgi:hypothetical protein